MTDDVVVRAKAALEGVTEGPWEMRDSFVYPLSISARLGGIRPGDAQFIAEARSLVPELVAELEAARKVLAELVDPDPCSFDHHGDCQAHGCFGFAPDGLCSHEAAKRLLGMA